MVPLISPEYSTPCTGVFLSIYKVFLISVFSTAKSTFCSVLCDASVVLMHPWMFFFLLLFFLSSLGDIFLLLMKFILHLFLKLSH